MTLKIGNVELENNVILAPMAGVTDMPYRILCREQGAGLVCMEMVSAKAILYKNKNTQELLKVDERERPVSLQLFGSDPDIVADIAASLEDGLYDIFDINMGCPVPKIVKNGEGSALMRNPKLVEEILTKLVKAVKKPVTVKFRKGFDDTCINAVEIAKIAESAGGCPWKNERAVLLRKSRLEYHPRGQKRGEDPGDRKRRCLYTAGCEAPCGGDGL